MIIVPIEFGSIGEKPIVGQLKKEIGNWGQRLTFDKLRSTLI